MHHPCDRFDLLAERDCPMGRNPTRWIPPCRVEIDSASDTVVISVFGFVVLLRFIAASR
jgi:hypothetical protein